VWKKQKLFGNGETFGFDYYPINGIESYRSTTDRVIGSRYSLVILDNEWNIYNDEK